MPLEAPLGRRVVARAIDLCLALLVLYVVARVVPEPRLLARLLLGLGALTAFEALFCLHLGATPGKLATALRVAELDRRDIDQVTAWTRGAVTTVGSLSIILVPSSLGVITDTAAGLATGGLVVAVAGGYALSVIAFPSRRGIADRIAGTIVVPFEAPAIISRTQVAADEEVLRPRPVTPWGPVASPDARRQARADRLDGSPLLLVSLVVVIVAWTVGAAPVAIGAACVFALLVVADEAVRIGRDAGTSGHRRHGLAVLDEATGEAPRRGASVARAITLGVFWLFPPLLPVLALWIQLAPSGRGPHDLIAGTVVVEVPRPEAG